MPLSGQPTTPPTPALSHGLSAHNSHSYLYYSLSTVILKLLQADTLAHIKLNSSLGDTGKMFSSFPKLLQMAIHNRVLIALWNLVSKAFTVFTLCMFIGKSGLIGSHQNCQPSSAAVEFFVAAFSKLF